MSVHINDIAALAWNATKPEEDPEFNGCILDHRLNLITRAKSVQEHGLVEPVQDFEKKVAELLKDEAGTENAVLKAQAESAQAVADAAAARAKAASAAASEAAKAATKSSKSDKK